MSSPAGAFDLPQRFSLSTQAASAMRKAIREGAWRESLPSERRLCEMLRISRPTVRTALRLLANEGLISIRQGRRNQLLQGGAVRPAAESRLVVLVSPEPLWHASVTAIQGISEMRTHLAAHGFTTEVMLCAPGRARKEQRKVETFLRQNRVFCCILLSVSKDLQEWFAARSIPALVLGSCHPSVRLPSLDVDYRAVCRHAVGVLRGKGHERLAFVVPNSRVAGDLASEAGFREGCHATAGSPAARSIVVRHDGGAKDLTGKLSALFASAQPPTALLVAKPQHVLIVLIDLLRRGISVPERVSLIARDYDSLFEIVLPSIAHYSFREEAYAHRLARLMQQMIGTGGLPAERNLIFPKYFSGGSVGAAAAI